MADLSFDDIPDEINFDDIEDEPINPGPKYDNSSVVLARPSTGSMVKDAGNMALDAGNEVIEGAQYYVTNPEGQKDLAVMAGSTIGGLAGASAGGLGMMGGSALGAGIGRSLWGTIYDPDVETQALGTAEEAATSLAFDAAIMRGMPWLKEGFKSLTRRLVGLNNDQSKQLITMAKELDLDMDMLAATQDRGVKSVLKIFGVVPFAGGPARENIEKGLGKAVSKRDEFLNQVAPTSTMYALGVDLTQAATKAHDKALVKADMLYRNFYDLATQKGNPKIIPTQDIVSAVDDLYAARPRPRVLSATGKKTGYVDPPAETATDRYIKQLKNMEGTISPAEARTLQIDLNALAKADGTSPSDLKKLAAVKGALESSLVQINDPQLKGALDVANKYWVRTKTRFGSATAQQFSRTDRNIFEGGYFEAGSLTSDKIGQVMLTRGTPQAVQELRYIVGSDEVHKYTRSYLDQAIQKSYRSLGEGTAEKAFNFEAFAQKIGLDTPNGREYLGELLRGTGVKITDLDKLISVGRAYQNVPLRDPSTFVARGLALGGLGALGTFSPDFGLLTGAAVVAVMRQGGKFLTDPAKLKTLTTVMDKSIPEDKRRLILSKMFQSGYLSLEEDTQEGPN